MERAPLAELDRILSRNELRPEEQEKRDSVLLPLEEALASVSTPPPATSESAASRVALCLWSKTHPESANIELLLTFAGDSEPLVRFCALEALSRIFAAQKTAIHPRLLYRVQEAIRERSRAEESVVVLYTVKRFANEIQQMEITSVKRSGPMPFKI